MKNDSGFTLIEVITALVLMGFLLIGMTMMPLRMRGMRARSEVKATAVMYAENIVEQYRNMSYTTLPDKTWQNITNLKNTNTQKNLNITYSYMVSVTGYNVKSLSSSLNNMLETNSTNPDVKQITVTVRWQGESLNGQIQQTSLIREN